MHLDEIEIRALTNLFRREDMDLALRVRDNNLFKVLAREKTSAGFYSIIQCTFKTRFMSEIGERSWAFEHPLLSQRSGAWPDELLPRHLI
ncbi:hypothetical protein [Pseudomonas sp. N40(2020)]|uniref:hypothetical protein n=1 Tax=Pseudomonas sp. N40(2020) TaxID=2767798 RepID=UPI0016572C27|nr:hypothetical protein [Pseudomonas sp. N40(2020)]